MSINELHKHRIKDYNYYCRVSMTLFKMHMFMTFDIHLLLTLKVNDTLD